MNALLEGPETAIDAVVERLWPCLREPIVCKEARAALTLPADAAGTLILREVAALTIHEQTQLLEWLDTATGRPRVVSTSSEPLFRRVRLRLFGEALYYRLNVLRLTVHSSDIRPDAERAFDRTTERRKNFI